MKACGVVTQQHLLDHLVPLCSLFEAPILCLTKEMPPFAEVYYPHTRFFSCENEEAYDAALKEYDLLIYVHFHRMFPYGFQFTDYLCNQKKRSLFSFHGQPDKFSSIYWMERVLEEDLVLLYGKKLYEVLQKKRIVSRLKPIISGNYRLAYYLKHRDFFQKKVSPFLFEDRTKTTLLFAPTWSKESLSSQFTAYFSPIEKTLSFLLEIPDNLQLLIKLHPLFLINNVDFLIDLEKKIENKPNIKLLPQIPLIYPLLEHVHIYVGDYSSIGYDFLYFNRPMFFLPKKMKTDLHSCGRVLKEEEWPYCYDIFQNKQLSLSKRRKQLYDEVFGPEKSLACLKTEIEKRYD